MMDNFPNTVIELYKEKNWREIGERYHDHPERNKLLWVYPTEDNFSFLRDCLEELKCVKILSIGCGSGLLEWIITEATGIPVSGVEVTPSWWSSKYSPSKFIPLVFTPFRLSEEVISILQDGGTTALMFCYFNNRPAFEEYTNNYSGNVLIIIGPGDGKGVHTDPKPFNDVSKPWTLHKYQEVRNSRDFIAVYYRN